MKITQWHVLSLLRLVVVLSLLCTVCGCWSSYWGRKHWWTGDGLTSEQRHAWQEYDRTNNVTTSTNIPAKP